MENLLIIPDIHTKWKEAEEIIKNNSDCNKVIFLGDYFDDYQDDLDSTKSAAEWLVYSINKPNRIHLFGNHEIPYWFSDNKMVRCSGFSLEKSKLINQIVKEEDWNKLKSFYVIDNKWLLSHAGVHFFWLNFIIQRYPDKNINNIKDVSDILKIEEESFIFFVKKNKLHWYMLPGHSRWKESPFYYGGILWLDWIDEFSPIRGINQIVGHTPSHFTKWKYLKENDDTVYTSSIDLIPSTSSETSYNICLDSFIKLNYYAKYKNGKMTIHERIKLNSPHDSVLF